MIGIGLVIPKRVIAGGAGVPSIVVSNDSITETGSTGVAVGTASIQGTTTGTASWSLAADPDNKFTINSSSGSITNDAALDYETKTAHSITVAVSGLTPSVSNLTFDVRVLNSLEVTLNALTLDTDELDEGSAEDTVVGALQGLTSGSTRSLIDTAGNRFKLSGTNIVAGPVATDYEAATSHNITLRETHADGSNSPRDSVIAIAVNDVEEGDVTAPTLSNATGVETGATTADLSVDTDEGNGTVYVSVTQSATPPSDTDIIAGTGADFADDQVVGSTGTKNFSATGLTAETEYWPHFVQVDAAMNVSNVISGSSFTTDEAPAGSAGEPIGLALVLTKAA